MSDVVYQTLGEFLSHPFNPTGTIEVPHLREDRERYEKEYVQNESNIFFLASTEFEESFFLHLKIPSKSKAGEYYDVVIQFFTDDGTVAERDSLDGYYLQFFSNSPSFIFKYAALYKEKGYLIDAFASKLDPEYGDRLPTSTNKDNVLSYDKSLYLACKYIQSNRLSLMSKTRLRNLKQVPMKTLIRNVASTNDINTLGVESKLKKEITEDKKKSGIFGKLQKARDTIIAPVGKKGKKTSVSSTLSTPRNIISKATPKKGKKKPTHSTKR